MDKSVESLQDEFPPFLLDVILKCQDGDIKASSHFLVHNSSVFSILLFSNHPFLDSVSREVLLNNVLVSDMSTLLKLLDIRQTSCSLLQTYTIDSIQSLVAIAHMYDFRFVLPLLLEKLSFLRPTPKALQFAEQLGLHSVLSKWSGLAECPLFFHDFVVGLVLYPLSDETVRAFSTVMLAERMRPKCM